MPFSARLHVATLSGSSCWFHAARRLKRLMRKRSSPNCQFQTKATHSGRAHAWYAPEERNYPSGRRRNSFVPVPTLAGLSQPTAFRSRLVSGGPAGGTPPLLEPPVFERATPQSAVAGQGITSSCCVLERPDYAAASTPAPRAFWPVEMGICFGSASARLTSSITSTPLT